jgi:hypothetical protein
MTCAECLRFLGLLRLELRRNNLLRIVRFPMQLWSSGARWSSPRLRAAMQVVSCCNLRQLDHNWHCDLACLVGFNGITRYIAQAIGRWIQMLRALFWWYHCLGFAVRSLSSKIRCLVFLIWLEPGDGHGDNNTVEHSRCVQILLAVGWWRGCTHIPNQPQTRIEHLRCSCSGCSWMRFFWCARAAHCRSSVAGSASSSCATKYMVPLV